jgi:hypothetical protein
MAWERRGVPQNMAVVLPGSFWMTQKGESSGIRLKLSWRHSRLALQPGQQLAG